MRETVEVYRKEQLCSAAPHYLVVFPSYLKYKQRHLSVVGEGRSCVRCCLVLYVFCLPFAFIGEWYFLVYKTCPSLNVVLLYYKQRASVFLQYRMVKNRQAASPSKHNSRSRSLPYRVLLAAYPVELKRENICSSSLCSSSQLLSDVNWKRKSFLLLVGKFPCNLCFLSR